MTSHDSIGDLAAWQDAGEGRRYTITRERRGLRMFHVVSLTGDGMQVLCDSEDHEAAISAALERYEGRMAIAERELDELDRIDEARRALKDNPDTVSDNDLRETGS